MRVFLNNITFILSFACIYTWLANSSVAAQTGDVSSSPSEILKDLKDSVITLDLKVNPLSKSNPKGSAVECEVAIRNGLPTSIVLPMKDIEIPIRIYIADNTGKTVGPSYQSLKVTAPEPRTEEKLAYITIKSNKEKIYKFLAKNDDNSPFLLQPGQYTAVAMLAIIEESGKSYIPHVLKSKRIGFDIE